MRKKSIKGHPPLYHVIPGRRPAPLEEQLRTLDEDERKVWCPLEKTIDPVTEDEEWRYLGKSLSKATVTWIKASLKRGW